MSFERCVEERLLAFHAAQVPLALEGVLVADHDLDREDENRYTLDVPSFRRILRIRETPLRPGIGRVGDYQVRGFILSDLCCLC